MDQISKDKLEKRRAINRQSQQKTRNNTAARIKQLEQENAKLRSGWFGNLLHGSSSGSATGLNTASASSTSSPPKSNTDHPIPIDDPSFHHHFDNQHHPRPSSNLPVPTEFSPPLPLPTSHSQSQSNSSPIPITRHNPFPNLDAASQAFSAVLASVCDPHLNTIHAVCSKFAEARGGLGGERGFRLYEPRPVDRVLNVWERFRTRGEKDGTDAENGMGFRKDEISREWLEVGGELNVNGNGNALLKQGWNKGIQSGVNPSFPTHQADTNSTHSPLVSTNVDPLFNFTFDIPTFAALLSPSDYIPSLSASSSSSDSHPTPSGPLFVPLLEQAHYTYPNPGPSSNHNNHQTSPGYELDHSAIWALVLGLVDLGKIDVEGLASEMCGKVRCYGFGPVVVKEDAMEVIRRYSNLPFPGGDEICYHSGEYP